MNRTVWALAAGLTLAGCTTSTMKTAQPVATKTTTAKTPPTSAAPATVGTALTAGPMRITLVQVIDPAQGGPYTTPNAGERFVATKFLIANTGTSILSHDINNDVSIQGSNGQTYSPDFNSISGCTNFNSGVFTITPGQSETGCAAFQLPSSVAVSQVQVSVLVGATTEVGQWKVG